MLTPGWLQRLYRFQEAANVSKRQCGLEIGRLNLEIEQRNQQISLGCEAANASKRQHDLEIGGLKLEIEQRIQEISHLEEQLVVAQGGARSADSCDGSS
jgi:hypothetical protein